MKKGLGLLAAIFFLSCLGLHAQCPPDFLPPTLLCPGNQLIYVGGSCQAPVPDFTSLATVSDNCDPNPVVSQDPVPNNIVSGTNVNITISLIAQDNSLNSSTCTFTATTVDTISPTIMCPPVQNLVMDASCQGSLPDYRPQATISDNCSPSPSTTQNPPPGSAVSGLGASTVTLTSTDQSSNSSTCSFTVNRLDTIAPIAICHDITRYLDNSGMLSITPSDLDQGSSDGCGNLNFSASQISFSCAQIGLQSVTLDVSDNSGNSSSCLSNVTVLDSIGPVAACQNLTVFLDNAGTASISESDVGGGSSDNCGPPSLNLNMKNFNCSHLGNNTVMLTVSDGSSNSSTCNAQVTVVDSTSPNALCNDVTLYLDQNGDASTSVSAVDLGSNDNCGPPSISLNATNFNCSQVGTAPLVLTATDVSGNTSLCNATATIIDTVAPIAVCNNQVVYLDANGSGNISLNDLGAGSSDNCVILSFSVGSTSLDCSDFGTNLVQMIATDHTGASDTCSATVTVLDTIPPTSICNDLTIYLDANGAANVLPSAIGQGSGDNCQTTNFSLDSSTFDCSDLGLQAVILTVTDTFANTDTCHANVTVADSIAPTVICNNPSLILNSAGLAVLTVADVDNGSSDNCMLSSLSIDRDNFSCADVGLNLVLLTASDANGNLSSCLSNVSVLDTQAPNALCRDISVFLGANGMASIDSSDIDNGSSDECTIHTAELSVNSFDCSQLGPNLVELTVSDPFGNSSSCFSNVTVMDAIAPMAVCVSVTLALDSTGAVQLTATQVDGGSSDNCGAVSTSISSSPTFDCSDIGSTTTGVLEVSDGSMNTDTCHYSFLIADNSPPEAVCQDDTIYLSGGQGTINASDIDGGSSDNCGIVSMAAVPNSFGTADLGANSVSLVVEDSMGNVDSCIATLLVVDPTVGTVEAIGLADGRVAIFPNPTTGFVTLRLLDQDSQLGKTAELRVSNALGQVLFSDQWKVGGIFEEHVYDLGPFPSGTFIFELEVGSERVLKQVVKKN